MNWNIKKPELSKKLSFYGTLIIVIAFAVQTFLYNEWDDKIKKLEQANRDYTEMTKTALVYQNLFLSVENQNNEVKDVFKIAYIQSSAEKYRLGRIISTNFDLFENKNDVKNFVNNTNYLLFKIKSVKDLMSLNAFVAETNALLPDNLVKKAEWFEKMEKKKNFASYIFISFQIIGSILLALGFRYQ